jgi:prephenate dehydratase
MTDHSLRVAFQGERGAYSDLAARRTFGDDIDTVPVHTFDDVFEAVAAGTVHRGVVPIENALAGTIHRNYDLMQRHDLQIIGETYLPVSHCLIAAPGVAVEDIRLVRSHPQALAQCEHTLRAMGVAEEAAYDTAGAVKDLAASGERDVAAIASRFAAHVYGMAVVRADVQDWPHNATRFLSLSRAPVAPADQAERALKVSLAFSLKSVSGALFKALAIFALRDLDLTKLESRPLPERPWDYTFYLDFVTDDFDGAATRAIENLREIAVDLTVLGRYPRNDSYGDGDKNG